MLIKYIKIKYINICDLFIFLSHSEYLKTSYWNYFWKIFRIEEINVYHIISWSLPKAVQKWFVVSGSWDFCIQIFIFFHKHHQFHFAFLDDSALLFRNAITSFHMIHIFPTCVILYFFPFWKESIFLTNCCFLNFIIFIIIIDDVIFWWNWWCNILVKWC